MTTLARGQITIALSEKGDKGDGVVNVYRAANSKPTRPIGSTKPPPGWSLSIPADVQNVTNIIYDTQEQSQWSDNGDGYWVSNPIGHNEIAKMRVTFNTTVTNQTIGIAIRVSSERSFDKLLVSHVNSTTVLKSYSGEVDEIVFVTATYIGTHYIEFTYDKDGSAVKGTDNAMVRILPTTSVSIWLSVGTIINGVVTTWSDPVQFKAKDGAVGRSLFYRGEFLSSKQYFQNSKRVDVVKYNSAYYMYKGINGLNAAWNANNWDSFGGQFESVATNLLLAENANIADWIIKGGKISSQQTISNGRSNAVLDGENGGIEFYSDVNKYTASGGNERVVQTIKISSSSGKLEVRNSDNEVSYISSQGIFSNRAGIQAVPLYTGVEIKAAVVALGFGDLQKSAYSNSGAICGVYADSSNRNSNPAPSWGAYIKKLRALGLFLGVRQITQTTYLNAYDCYVPCYNTTSINVYLPSNPQDGQIILVVRLNSASVTVQGNGKRIHIDGNTVTSKLAAPGRGDAGIYIYDGQYWKYNHILR
ncbi:MAG: hypothetical protein SNG81_04385 [Rikenellaceae bacterium]